MPERRYIEVYEQGTGRLLSRTPYIVPDAELLAEQDAQEVKAQLLEKGRQALANWTSLTLVQKDAILKALLRYVLWREGRA